jgi:hypothetical protein
VIANVYTVPSSRRGGLGLPVGAAVWEQHYSQEHVVISRRSRTRWRSTCHQRPELGAISLAKQPRRGPTRHDTTRPDAARSVTQLPLWHGPTLPGPLHSSPCVLT